MFKRWLLRHWLLAIMISVLTGGYAYAADVARNEGVPQLNGKVLVVMTNHSKYPSRSDTTGLWFTELTHFYDVAQAAGLQMDFASPAGGGEVPIDERSLKSFYLDDSARAHLADPAFMARLKATLPAAAVDPADYKAIYFTGGHGTLWDFPDNAALKAVSEQIYRQGGCRLGRLPWRIRVVAAPGRRRQVSPRGRAGDGLLRHGGDAVRHEVTGSALLAGCTCEPWCALQEGVSSLYILCRQ
ncbi:type 1 glutamine amidotransferase domain-containing protein [Burkholderia cenocepacia]|uniref:type 1 glutamine amidotransferase domain-containing protein n=1 Tax=Burkholderia cenocepacia TaxID=95486 RepID=UPI00209AC51B|nr:type 1 glutamine amidotransferase domain-containing protein [Burkholderia cenocepacia]